MSVAKLLSSTSNNSACLTVPKLSTVDRDAIQTPTNGLTIYNTNTNSLNYYNGTVWKDITGTSGGTGITTWYLGAAENFPALAVFPIGSASANNFIKSFSTFSGADVTCSSGLFTLPSDGVYRINITVLFTRTTPPTTGDLTVSMLNNSGVYFTSQYTPFQITNTPPNFNFNFGFVGVFSGANKNFQFICHNSSNGAFTVEGAVLPNDQFQTCVSIQKIE